MQLRDNGALGFVATNTAYQGDTRRAGLSWISTNGGVIYSAVRRMAWPGRAAVVVCIVHIARVDDWLFERRLNGKAVPHLSPLLLPVAMDGEPKPLNQSDGKAFKGCEIGSLGFLFSAEEVAHLSSCMRPDGTPLIKEYIGGEDLNRGPMPVSGRFAIDSDGTPRSQLPPEAVELLRSTLLADLLRRGIASEEDQWWNFRRPSTEMRRLLASGEGGLAVARVSSTFGITRLAADLLPNETVVLFDLSGDPGLCVLQSRGHEVWCRALSGTMKDDLRYTPSDGFETFPFPLDWEANPTLEAAGKAYYEFRAALMVKNDDGLTDVYNRFHDPDERDSEIVMLRDLHAAMDRTVLDVYGWSDIPTECKFLLDYEIDEGEWGNKKKPWRYRWPDEVRDEVLARLLELNAERAKEEVRSGAAATEKRGRKSAAKRAAREPKTGDLF